MNCNLLLVSECNTNEFRCDNGLCIPKEFFNDGSINPDCMDRSDERLSHAEYEVSGDYTCQSDTSFKCEETTCRNERSQSCGDGHCSLNGCTGRRDERLKEFTFSLRANPHLSFTCWVSLICLAYSASLDLPIFQDVICSETVHSENLFRENCPLLFIFPAQPILLNHVRFVYATNLSYAYDRDILLPHYVCYDQELCDWLPATFFIHNLTCRHVTELNVSSQIPEFKTFAKTYSGFFSQMFNDEN